MICAKTPEPVKRGRWRQLREQSQRPRPVGYISCRLFDYLITATPIVFRGSNEEMQLIRAFIFPSSSGADHSVGSSFAQTGGPRLAAHWTLDEVTGTAQADSSRDGNVGTLVNMDLGSNRPFPVLLTFSRNWPPSQEACLQLQQLRSPLEYRTI